LGAGPIVFQAAYFDAVFLVVVDVAGLGLAQDFGVVFALGDAVDGEVV